MARLLGVEKRPGLAEVLHGDAQLADTIYDTPLPNLKLLPAGDSVGDGYAALLSGASTRMTLSRLRASFDYVLVDTPPVNTVSDVSMLAPHCDGVIMVIEMRRTPEPTVQQAVRTLQTNNVKILGCLLSRFRDGRAGYYDRYYSYYRNE
jgi:capsular exopolysaccharide synthesis family protein